MSNPTVITEISDRYTYVWAEGAWHVYDRKTGTCPHGFDTVEEAQDVAESLNHPELDNQPVVEIVRNSSVRTEVVVHNHGTIEPGSTTVFQRWALTGRKRLSVEVGTWSFFTEDLDVTRDWTFFEIDQATGETFLFTIPESEPEGTLTGTQYRTIRI